MTLFSIMAISFGTYFGECIGYCNETVFVTADEIRYTVTASIQHEKLPPITVEVPIERKEWEALSKLVDLHAFSSLKKQIGCPDCADQGGEFIEISDATTTRRVDFEFGASVPEVDALLNEMRKLRIRLSREHKPV